MALRMVAAFFGRWRLARCGATRGEDVDVRPAGDRRGDGCGDIVGVVHVFERDAPK